MARLHRGFASLFLLKCKSFNNVVIFSFKKLFFVGHRSSNCNQPQPWTAYTLTKFFELERIISKIIRTTNLSWSTNHQGMYYDINEIQSYGAVCSHHTFLPFFIRWSATAKSSRFAYSDFQTQLSNLSILASKIENTWWQMENTWEHIGVVT